jgi:hypothetical protein
VNPGVVDSVVPAVGEVVAVSVGDGLSVNVGLAIVVGWFREIFCSIARR